MISLVRTYAAVEAILKSKEVKNVAKFKIDDKEYDTENLTSMQKRILDLYQRALKDEAEAIANLELRRAARLEVSQKLKQEIIDKA